MSETTDKTEEQRGKRRSARFTEITLVVLMVCSMGNVPNAFDILKLVLIPGLAYAASLRGLDAYFKRV